MARTSSAEPPDPADHPPAKILLASEERDFAPHTVDYAARLSARTRAPVHVFVIARIHGTTFGFPNPGLMPTRKEWDARRQTVERAVAELKRRGVAASGGVLGTRRATKRIIGEAERLGCDAIVMEAGRERGKFVGDFMWNQEAWRVRRKSPVPVYIVPEDPEEAAGTLPEPEAPPAAPEPAPGPHDAHARRKRKHRHGARPGSPRR
ncbi:MAG: universal stress protein [Solirubrobacteraceae bacterium]